MNARTRRVIGRNWMLTLAAAVLGTLAGCNGDPLDLSGQKEAGFLSAPLPAITPDRAYEAALAELGSKFTLVSQDAALRNIQTAPQYVDPGSGADTGRLHIISSPSNLRRIAQARVRTQAGAVKLEVRVMLQRRDTAQYAAYHQMRSSSDVPNQTPLDQGMDLPPEQREVWSDVRRDITVEHEIVEGVQRRLGLAATPADSAVPAAPSEVAPALP
ncbi:MAG: hypothetical protein BIFFINMI_02150 [Phycisphaerae bacterium]|nr:hypothetical protein [Phycisphaerae bacterium]